MAQETEELIQELKGQLTDEIRSFGYLTTEEDIAERLSADVEPVLQARQESADALLSRCVHGLVPRRRARPAPPMPFCDSAPRRATSEERFLPRSAG